MLWGVIRYLNGHERIFVRSSLPLAYIPARPSQHDPDDEWGHGAIQRFLGSRQLRARVVTAFNYARKPEGAVQCHCRVEQFFREAVQLPE